jgi:hypothetical protein
MTLVRCPQCAVVLIVLVMLAGAPFVSLAGDGPRSSFCATGDPSSVFTCLTSAYADRDLQALRALLADDFQFVPGDEANAWGVDVEMGMHEKLFVSPDIQKLALAIAEGYEVAAGGAPDTWVISGVTAQLALSVMKDGEPKQHTVTVSGQEFRVRLVREPEAHFVIVRWWQPATH